MEDLGASTLFVGVSLTMYGIPFAIVASMAGKFIYRSGPWMAATFAVAIIVPMTVIYGFLVSPFCLWVWQWWKPRSRDRAPACQAAMVECTHEGERATVKV